MQAVMLLAIAAIVSFSFTVNAAEKLPPPPYEYTFEKDAGMQFNGIDGVKKIKMTFYDKSLSVTDIALGDNFYVLHGGNKVNIIQPIRVEGNTVTIAFKNLEYLDHKSKALDYEVVIEKDAKLHFDQLEDYHLPFKLYEVLPGFESVFIHTSAETMNENILKKNNSYRDITVYVPKMYLTGIETLHRYKGVADPSVESHSMTNMDVQADQEARRLTVSVNDEEQYARDLTYRTDVGGFTMGQAGLEALVCQGQAGCTGTAKDFHLTAFNDYGKVLTNRNFKVRVTNQTSGFKVNDYIAKPDKIFGQSTSVYNLMQDPKLLQTIASQIPVTELDTLGVMYDLGDKVEVANYEQLQMALANTSIKNITLTDSIIGDVTTNHSVTINGEGHGISGDVTLSGNEAIVRLKNTTISGNVTIGVGANGAAILENVVVNGSVTATSGSLHFFGLFTPNPINIANDVSMRVVNVGSTPNMTLSGAENVIFIGTFGDVTVAYTNAQLEIKRNTDIGKIIIHAPDELILRAPHGKTIPPQEGDGLITVIYTDPIEGEGGQTVSEWYYPEFLSQSNAVWEQTGVRLTFDQAPSTIEWSVVNPQVFGGQSQVFWRDGLLYITEVMAEQMKEVVLQGSDDDGQLYRVTILVGVEVEIQSFNS